MLSAGEGVSMVANNFYTMTHIMYYNEELSRQGTGTCESLGSVARHREVSLFRVIISLTGS